MTKLAERGIREGGFGSVGAIKRAYKRLREEEYGYGTEKQDIFEYERDRRVVPMEI